MKANSNDRQPSFRTVQLQQDASFQIVEEDDGKYSLRIEVAPIPSEVVEVIDAHFPPKVSDQMFQAFSDVLLREAVVSRIIR